MFFLIRIKKLNADSINAFSDTGTTLTNQEKAEEQQREIYRKQWQNWVKRHRDVLDKLPPTEFVGYDEFECEATVVYAD